MPVGDPFYFIGDSVMDIIADENSLTDYKLEREFWKIMGKIGRGFFIV